MKINLFCSLGNSVTPLGAETFIRRLALNPISIDQDDIALWLQIERDEVVADQKRGMRQGRGL